MAPAGSLAERYKNYPGEAGSYSSVIEQTCAAAGLMQDVNCSQIAGKGLDIGRPLNPALFPLGTEDPSFVNNLASGVGGDGTGAASNLDGIADIVNVSDVSSGTQQISDSRRYHPSQGRWESPDDVIPDEYNPQTLNAYHYSLNMPTTVQDPSGRQDWIRTGTCAPLPCDFEEQTAAALLEDQIQEQEWVQQQEQNYQIAVQQMAQLDIASTRGFGRVIGLLHCCRHQSERLDSEKV